MVHRFSQRRCNREEVLDDIDKREYQATTSVFPLSLGALVRAHCRCLVQSPVQYLSALVGSLRFSPPGLMGMLYGLVYFVQGISLVEKLSAAGVDKVHMHFANSGMFVGVAACNYLRLPWSVSLHGRSDFDYPGVMALPNMLEQAEFVRCISHFGASQVVMRQCKPEYWDKILISYCGLPAAYIEAAPRDIVEKNPGDTLTLLNVGRLSPEKGQWMLLDLVAALHQRGAAVELILVGDGPDRKALEKRALEMGINKRCVFAGAVSENRVLDYMREADVFVCSSLMEGLPQVLMEAAAVKLPVVAPYLAGIPEFIRDGETGVLFIVGDGDDLLEAVTKYSNSSSLMQSCADNAYQLLGNRFLLPRTIEPLSERLIPMQQGIQDA